MPALRITHQHEYKPMHAIRSFTNQDDEPNYTGEGINRQPAEQEDEQQGRGKTWVLQEESSRHHHDTKLEQDGVRHTK
jgi:hypothetical protein